MATFVEALRPNYPVVRDKDSTLYLLGLRGWFVIQSFLWVFMQTFVPAAVKSFYNNTAGPAYQVGLRKSLSVLFWNDNLIYSFFILISARTICLPFLCDPTKVNVASAVFRRGLRLWFPTAVALAVTKLIFSQTGTAYIDEFKQKTGNTSITTPYHLPNALAYFNSVFNLFWITHDFIVSAGNSAFPSQLMWIINVIYMQSYTVYATMLVAPYTRRSWRVQAAILFVITAWWVQSWAWFTITGLILADMVVNMDFKAKAQRGIPLWKSRGVFLPSWIAYVLVIVAGLIMQFLWTAWKPQKMSAEIVAHAGLYYTGGLNTEYDPSAPQARADAYLILAGLLFAVDTYDWLQWVFRNPVLVYLGTRSLSASPHCVSVCLFVVFILANHIVLFQFQGWFYAQGIIVYTAGIKLFLHLTAMKGWSQASATGISLLVCLSATVVIAELFYRLVDYPCRAMSYRVFDWIRQ